MLVVAASKAVYLLWRTIVSKARVYCVQGARIVPQCPKRGLVGSVLPTGTLWGRHRSDNAEA
jgi:hypothetical protein